LASFVVLVRTYAVWIYLVLVLGIFFGVKLLVDARRLSRTTLFSLDQERATEQTYRSLLLVGILIVGMFFVTVIVVLVAPLAPQTETSILRGVTSTLPPIVFSTSTRTPTQTSTVLPPTETPFFTATPTITATTPTRVVIRPTLAASTPTSVYALPAPMIIGPLPNGGTWTGEGQANAAITFRWNCDQCVLGSNDYYEVVISFTDRSGVPRSYSGRSQEKFLSLKQFYIGGGLEIYQKAKEDTFQWYVQVKRDPGNQPLSPPSDTWKFIWH
jgi:hypothetical protein